MPRPHLTDAEWERIKTQRAFAQQHRALFKQLSRREVEILTYVARGLTNKAIAKELFLSVHTVRTHRQNIRRQLGIKDAVEAVYWGLAFGLV